MAFQAISKNMQELRIIMCQSSPASEGARSFVLSGYKQLKAANPRFPFLVRESAGVEPMMFARYDFGVEKSVSLTGKDAAGVAKELEALVKHGETLPRSGGTA